MNTGARPSGHGYKLIVYGIYLAPNEPESDEHKAWKDDIQHLKSDDIDVRLIRLNMTTISNEMNGESYEKEMRRLRDRLKDSQPHQKRLRDSVKRATSALQRRCAELFRRDQKYTEPRDGRFTRYMFIADGLATWMVKDLLFRDPGILANTVGLVFWSIQIPTVEGTNAQPGNIKNVTGTNNSTGDYVVYLAKVFGLREDQNVRLLQDPSEESVTLVSKLQSVDKDYSKLHPSPAFVWEILPGIDQNETTLQRAKSVRRDLEKLTETALILLSDESKWSVTDLQVTIRRRATGDSLENKRELSRHTRRYTKPFNSVVNHPNYDAAAQTTSPKFESAMPSLDNEHPSTSAIGSVGLRDQAISYFFSNRLGVADRLLTAYIKNPDLTNSQSEESNLEVALFQGITWLHLGRYDEAKSKFEEALDKAKNLKINLPEDRYDSEILDIEVQLTFWYSKALVYMGYYENARLRLTDLVGGAESDKTGNSKACPERFVEVHIGAHQILSLIRNYTGDFQSVKKDGDLTASYKMLERLRPSDNQSQKGQAEQQDTKYLERDLNQQGSAKETWVRRLHRQRPAVLETEHGLTVSQIEIVQGDLKGARKRLEEVVYKLNEDLGANHVLTLEATVLLAGLLVNTASVAEGEQLAQDARSRIAEHLNKYHPLAMEATHVSITAYTAQGWEEQALRASQHLCQDVETYKTFRLTHTAQMSHPRVSAYYTQLCNAHVAVGNYKEAEICLKAIFEDSGGGKGVLAPTRARNLSHLAWALLHLGKYESAERRLGQALEILLRPETPYNGTIAPKAVLDHSKCRAKTLADSKAVLRQLAKISVHNQDEIRPVRVHPDILFTIQVCSELESRQIDPDIDFVLEARKALFTNLSNISGQYSFDTLRAQLSMGYAMVASGRSKDQPKLLSEASQQFQQVFQSCYSEARPVHLYKDHPLSLEAKREVLLFHIMDEKISELKVKELIKLLDIIFAKQCQSLGSYRTQTLQTCLSRLSATVTFLGSPSDENRNDLLDRLRDPKVRKQRMVESLLMEERVSQIYSMAGQQHISEKILESLIDCERLLNGIEEDNDIKKACKETSRRAKKSLKNLGT